MTQIFLRQFTIKAINHEAHHVYLHTPRISARLCFPQWRCLIQVKSMLSPKMKQMFFSPGGMWDEKRKTLFVVKTQEQKSHRDVVVVVVECVQLLVITYSFKEEQGLKLIHKNLEYDVAHQCRVTSYPSLVDPSTIPDNYHAALATLRKTANSQQR